jgi:hypothetical protein
MAIKILRFGNGINVENPVLLNADSTEMVDVIWAEIGQRPGANKDISESSRALDIILKQELEDAGIGTSGLDNFRIHTQPVKKVLVQNGHLKLGVEYDGFINRRLHSVPQLRQQQGVAPRMIDGRPTFFTTKIELKPLDDMDERMSNEQLSKIHPEYFDGSIVSQTARTHIQSTTSTREAIEQQEEALVNDTSNAEHPLADLQFPG